MRNLDDDPGWWLNNHGPRLLAFARQWTTTRADAEDLLQEAFVRFWQTRRTVRQPLLHLYRCIRRVALNVVRADARRRRREQETLLPGNKVAESSGIEQSERAGRIRQALSRLPEEQRAIVSLKVWSDMTFDEIAQIIDMPRSSAHALYGRAMAQLQAELDSEVAR